MSASAAPIAAAATDCTQTAAVTEIAPGVYVRAGHSGVVFEQPDIANVGFIVGTQCAAVIDTGGSRAEGEALRCALREVTDLPVCYVINTHVHPDHVFGNAAFEVDNPTFIGHERLPRALSLLGPTYLKRAGAEPDLIVFPERLIDAPTELDLGGRRLTVRPHKTAHTDNDLSVYDDRTATLWLSDLLFLEHVPVLDGSVLGWLAVLDDLRQQPAQRAVPGHGPIQVSWPAAAAASTRYFTVLRDETRAMLAQGGDLMRALEQVGARERQRWTLFDQYHKRNVTRAYAELEWED